MAGLFWVGGSSALPASGGAVVGQLAGALWSGGARVVVGWAGGAGGPSSASGLFASAWPLSRVGGSGLVVSAPAGASAVRSAAARGAVGAVAVLASPASRGSLAALALAVRLGVPCVVAVPCGFVGPPAPLPGVAGSWRSVSVAGLAAWRWVS